MLLTVKFLFKDLHFLPLTSGNIRRRGPGRHRCLNPLPKFVSDTMRCTVRMHMLFTVKFIFKDLHFFPILRLSVV